MAKFIEVLETGLTVRNAVRRAGDRVQVPDDFPLTSKRKQTKRWGAPRYREISREDYEGTGGKVLDNEIPEVAEIPEAPVVEEAVEVSKFPELEGLNAEATLAAVVGFSDAEMADFVAFEVAGENRKSVLEPLGYGTE